MITDTMNKILYQSLNAYGWGWVKDNRVAITVLVLVLGLTMLSYGLVCVADAISGYQVQRNMEALDAQTRQLEKLARQVEQLRLDIQQREASLARIYEQVLKREGRLTQKHIVNAYTSRLVANDSSLGPRAPTIVSRSYSRYSPFHFDVTMPSAVTAYELEQVLAKSDLTGTGSSFVQAELTYGINAMFLAALAIHESHWGKSALARDKNNLYGFGAYDANPYLHAASFPSKHECIMHVAKYLRDNYINGRYSNGRNISDINHMYASDPQWSEKIFILMLQIDNMIQKMPV